MKVTISLTVNGAQIQRDVEPRTSLADFLREELRLTATHLGCEHGVCGACTVMVDGAPARACIALAVSLDGAEIRTVEGFAEDAAMGVIKEAFHQEHGLQCGFCTPGMLISARDLIARYPEADEDGIRRAMSGNLCRCTGYQGIVRSIKSAARQLSSQGKQP
jgi:carbon-monoxide dehydrogenase small subunit